MEANIQSAQADDSTELAEVFAVVAAVSTARTEG
jgi:hypothetical protein